MSLISSRGIVFRKIHYGETSLIADIYTEEKGLHSFIAGSVRTAKSQMPLSLFQAMMPVELVSYFKENTEGHLNRIKEIRPLFPLIGIPFDFRKGAVALFLSEICRQTIRETQSDPELFAFLLENITFLDIQETTSPNLHLHFLIQLTTFLGFTPAPRLLDEPFFDLKNGIPTPQRPGHLDYFSGDAVEHLYALLDAPLTSINDLPLNVSARRTLLQHLLSFYRFHSPGFKDLNTLSILDQLYR